MNQSSIRSPAELRRAMQQELKALRDQKCGGMSPSPIERKMLCSRLKRTRTLLCREDFPAALHAFFCGLGG